MIVRESLEGGLILIGQTDHAKLSGQCAAHWGNEKFARPQPYESVVRAAMFHDSGWYDYETSPSVAADTGRPLNFLQVTWGKPQRRAFEWAIEWMTRIDPYSGRAKSLKSPCLSATTFRLQFSSRHWQSRLRVRDRSLSSDRLTPPFAGGKAVAFFERVGEVRLATKAASVGNLSDRKTRLAGIGQHRVTGRKSRIANEIGHRLVAVAKNTVKGPDRYASCRGDGLGVKPGFRQVRTDIGLALMPDGGA
jgi:hypothetical protein